MRRTINILLISMVLGIIQCYNDSDYEYLNKNNNKSQVVDVAKWPNGEIPYIIEEGFSEQEIRNIEYCISDWEEACGVTFIEKIDERGPYILTIEKAEDDAPAAEGTVGYTENAFIIVKGIRRSKISHELGHIIGFLHEHQRPDRDDYIDVLWENIQPEYFNNYIKMDSTLINETNFIYDVNSVMHYSQYAGNVELGDHTYDIIDEEVNITKSSRYLSIGDIEKAESIYGPSKK